MFFAGRPELQLPSAPETRLLRVLRWVAVLAASTNAFLLLGAIALNFIYQLPWLEMAPAFIISVTFLGVSCEIYAAARRRHELAYWTPPRVQTLHPTIWHLYCAANTTDNDLSLRAARRGK